MAAQDCLGRLQALVRQRDAGIAELGWLAYQAAVARVGAVTLGNLAGGEQLRCKLPPRIGELCIERDRTPQCRQRRGVAAVSRVGPRQLELHECRLGLVPCQGFEQASRGGRITGLAMGGGEQQARLGVAR